MIQTRYFRHFKGNYYKLLCIALDSESQERMCVYQALYGAGQVWVRPESMFFETIERDGARQRRFAEVTADEALAAADITSTTPASDQPIITLLDNIDAVIPRRTPPIPKGATVDEARAQIRRIMLGEPEPLSHAEFRRQAREHQWRYMQKWVNEANGDRPIDQHSANPSATSRDKRVWLTPEMAARGLVFYCKLRDEILRGSEFARDPEGRVIPNKMLTIVLRSEHIPYNLFYPLRRRLDDPRTLAAVNYLAGGDSVERVEMVEIEYAPSPKGLYLNDNTSFDTYVQYVNSCGERCGLGIEVKYTEKEYDITPTPGKKPSKQWTDTHDEVGRARMCTAYRQATDQSGYYLPGHDEELVANELRQIWRNHILGAAMVARGDIDRFRSLTIYPRLNKHFHDAESHYREVLTDKGNDTVAFATYEDYFDRLQAIYADAEGAAWVNYLRERYIFPPEN